MTEIYFTQFWRLGSLRSRCQPLLPWGELSPQPPFLCVLTDAETPLPRPQRTHPNAIPPKRPISKTITSEVRASTHEFAGGDNSIHYSLKVAEKIAQFLAGKDLKNWAM